MSYGQEEKMQRELGSFGWGNNYFKANFDEKKNAVR